MIRISVENVNQELCIGNEFANIDLNDKRLTKRCISLAGTLLKDPMAPINQASENQAEMAGAYRFFANEKVAPDKIQPKHYEQTAERMSQVSVALAIQDTTTFNYAHHPQTAGLGPIGNKNCHGKGFLMHSTITVTPDGLPLGLLSQEFIIRPEGEPTHTPNELRKTPIEEKESYKWLKAFKQTIKLSPSGTKVVTVCDREADIYEMFTLAQEKSAPLLVRAAINRRLQDVPEAKLWDKAEQAAIAGHLLIETEGNQNQRARQTNVTVRFTEVTLTPPWRPNQKKLLPIKLTAILVREENPSEEVENPIEWLLLINEPVSTFEDASEIIEWYATRWQIEVFHKILKSGCQVEKSCLGTARRLQNYIALMSVVAWRLHRLTYINRTNPDAPCNTVLTDIEWEALYMRIHKTKTLPEETPTVREAVRWIARLGGFIGRKGDGEPGITTTWRGWRRLQDLAEIWRILKGHN